jgi:outer membrane protein W
MKKSFLVLVILALAAGGAFAQIGLSTGGGLFFDGSFGNGMEMSLGGKKITTSINNTSFGAYGFFDATYMEASLGFAYGTLKLKGDDGDKSDSDDMGTAMQISFTVLGKYPIDLGVITLFPMLGLSYNLVVSLELKDGYKKSGIEAENLGQLGLLGGIGLDYDLTQSMYLRASLLLHLRFASKHMTDNVDDLKKMRMDANTTLGVGPRIQVGLGFRF